MGLDSNMIRCACGEEYSVYMIMLKCAACNQIKVHKENIKKVHYGCQTCVPIPKRIDAYICCDCELMPKLVCGEVYVVTQLPKVLCGIIGNFMEATVVIWQKKCFVETCYAYSCGPHDIQCNTCLKSICSRHQAKCVECRGIFCLDCWPIHNRHPKCGFIGPICAAYNLQCAFCKITSNHPHIAYRKRDNVCQTEAVNVCCDHIGYFSEYSRDEITHTMEHNICVCKKKVCRDDLKKCDECSAWGAHGQRVGTPSPCDLCEGKIIYSNLCCRCLPKFPAIVNYNHMKLCGICKKHACPDHFKRVWGHCSKCDVEGNRSKFLYTDE